MAENIKLRSGSTWKHLTPIRGVGFPNGVISAPVGTEYIDENSTNGAQKWIKSSGTGNTGWVVSVGDTGWRDLTSLFSADIAVVNSNDYGVLVRRTNSEVKFNIKAQTSTTWAGQTTPIPQGFRQGNKPVTLREALQTGGSGRGQLQFAASLYFVSSTMAVGSRFAFDTVYSATDPWPTTLPGGSA